MSVALSNKYRLWHNVARLDLNVGSRNKELWAEQKTGDDIIGKRDEPAGKSQDSLYSKTKRTENQ